VGQQERLGHRVVVEPDGDHHAGLGDPVVGWRAHLCVAQHLVQPADPGLPFPALVERSLLRRGITRVARVRAERSRRSRALPNELGELGLQPLAGVRGQPHLCSAHRSSSGVRRARRAPDARALPAVRPAAATARAWPRQTYQVRQIRATDLNQSAESRQCTGESIADDAPCRAHRSAAQ
jgi:hypothetical protein